ncbi:PTS mannitol transporter subunit IICB [Vibrio sp. SA48]
MNENISAATRENSPNGVANGNIVKIQRLGNFLSGMVMPNLGIFVAWGLLTALFIPTGWLPNEHLAKLVGPILNYLLPMLIGFTGGYMIHNRRGGALGALATVGLIVGTDITMLSGAMIVGPLSAYLMKKIDLSLEGKFKAGMEMFVSNFSMGFVGLAIVILCYLLIGPIVQGLMTILMAGVNWTLDTGTLPLISIFVAPAQVLFLNNAINHGIMGPLGIEQVAEMGKSILFLVDANCGPSVGTLIAISLFGKGMAKRTAPTAAFIAGVGGIGEVYFPFILMKPILVLATMAGITTSLSLFILLGGGTVATPSPGSFFAMLMLTPKGAMTGNLIGFFAGMAVSFTVGAIILKMTGKNDLAEEEDPETISSKESISHNSATYNQLNSIDPSDVKLIVVACDAGLGSSAMGASVLRTAMSKAMINIKVINTKIEEVPDDADIIITHAQLADRAKKSMDIKQ